MVDWSGVVHTAPVSLPPLKTERRIGIDSYSSPWFRVLHWKTSRGTENNGSNGVGTRLSCSPVVALTVSLKIIINRDDWTCLISSLNCSHRVVCWHLDVHSFGRLPCTFAQFLNSESIETRIRHLLDVTSEVRASSTMDTASHTERRREKLITLFTTAGSVLVFLHFPTNAFLE